MGTGYTRNDTGNNIADGNIINASDLDGEFDAVESAFNSSTGHTHDGTSAEGGPITKLGPVQDLVVSATAVTPKTDNTLDLGSASLEFKDGYFDGTVNIDSLVADTADINGGSVDGVTIGTNSAATEVQIDNININGNTISSTDTNGDITLAPDGTGVVALSSTDLTFGDNDKAVFGAGSDLQIYHNGSASVISDVGTGNFFISGDNDVFISKADLSEVKAKFSTNGAVTLYYDNSAKLATSASGIDVTGTITFDGGTTSADLNFGDNVKAVFGAGSDLQIYHDGSNSYISEQGTGNLFIQADAGIVIESASTGENYIAASANGAVTLFYDNASKLATTSTGIDVTGTITADNLTMSDSSTPQITLTDTTNSVTGVVFADNGEMELGTTSNHAVAVKTNDTERLRITNGGNVGIGTSGPATQLEIDGGASSATYRMTNDATAAAGGNGLNLSIDNSLDASLTNAKAGALKFGTSNAERLRIDSSGNVLVGKTASGVANTGAELQSSGFTSITRDGGAPLQLNRKTSDGDLFVAKKDGTTVGSIGVNSGDNLYFSTANTGFKIADDELAIIPANSDGSNSDNDTDLGMSAVRFKDLYLSGGAYLGGTAAANKLDDYEEGTFTPVAEGETTAGSGTYNYQVGSYVKVGSLVLFQANVQWSSHTGSGVFRLSGLPFTAKNTTNLFAVAASYLSGLPVASNHRAMPFVRPNTSYVNINQENGSGGASSVNIDAAAQVLITGSYRTDA